MESGRGADVNEPFLRDSAADDEFIVDDSDILSNEPLQKRWHQRPSVSTWLAFSTYTMPDGCPIRSPDLLVTARFRAFKSGHGYDHDT